MNLKSILIGILLIASLHYPGHSQKATITESVEKFTTYPYSDPDPVANMTKFYPYFRYDGFTIKPVEQDWTIITLENEYIKVFVAPEIGGKVLGAIDKSSGEEFIYYNKVMKFRDIAMRGAWASGGIEFNFGSIGHAPSTASPVNYVLKENNDGSVSCFVGAPDITSRTEWRMEIRLPADKSYFETNGLWHNPSDLKTSLYNWSTASVDATDDLEYYFPGTTQIGHDGDAYTWPVNKNGVDLSLYKNNNFGGNNSYHVLGEYADYFLCYFADKEFGLGHWAEYAEKPGQKIWIWALSREGAIWHDLLTDPGNNQYSEIQTGLLFNQAADGSGYTPFKHRFFGEGAVHRFRELWFPVKGTGGIVKANEAGSLNVVQNQSSVKISFCANQEINDELQVFSGGKELIREQISLKPTGVYSVSIEDENIENVTVKIGSLISYSTKEKNERSLSRPVEINEGFNWKSADAVYTLGVEKEKQREYASAETHFLNLLKIDSFHTGALTRLAGLHYRKMEYETAKELVLKALANDTYHPEANYLYGLINLKLKMKFDALDAFSLAGGSMEYRSVANVKLAEIYFTDGEFMRSLKYANEALDYNNYNMNALKLKALIHEKMGQLKDYNNILNEILQIDPLNTFAHFEKGNDLSVVLNYEMPGEIVLEQAIVYFNLGLKEKAVSILNTVQPTPVIHYWLAFLLNDPGYIEKALAASPELVFPSRAETLEVLQWAAKQNNHWKTKYYLGLLYWSKLQKEKARQLFSECGNQPDYFAFYLSRHELLHGQANYNGEADLLKAMELNPDSWRNYLALSDYYAKNQNQEKALKWAQKGFSKFPANYLLAYQVAKGQLQNQKYAETIQTLENTTILPNEGAKFGRVTFRQANIMKALENFKQTNWQQAFNAIEKAREWPENLGVGKPYDTDERIEDYLESLFWANKGEKQKAGNLEKKIIDYTLNSPAPGSSDLLGAIVLKKHGQEEAAKKLLDNWRANEPKSNIARWSWAKFNGNDKVAEEIKNEIILENEGNLFNMKSNDADFALIQAILTKDFQ